MNSNDRYFFMIRMIKDKKLKGFSQSITKFMNTNCLIPIPLSRVDEFTKIEV